MADVFQVLKRDHEEVKDMLAQLEDGQRAAAGATAEQLASRQRLVERLIIEESKHEAAEQQYFWPALRQLGSDGGRVADQAMEQETEAEQVLAELEQLDAADQRFDGLLAAFTSSARAHILFEEAHAWPLLEASITADEAEALGALMTQAKALAPTRPHPGTPPPEGASATVPLQGIADRLRDAVTGRGRGASS